MILVHFEVFRQPFGTLGLVLGALGPQVGIMTPRGGIGGEFVIQNGVHFELHFRIFL